MTIDRRSLLAGLAAAGALAATGAVIAGPTSAFPPLAQALRDEPIQKMMVIKSVVMQDDRPTAMFYAHVRYGSGVDRIDSKELILEAADRIATNNPLASANFIRDVQSALQTLGV